MMEQKKSRFSKLKVGIATVAVAALLVIPASADQHTQDVGFEITGGDFTHTLTEDTAMNNVDYSVTETGESTGVLTVDVNDDRGTEEGWTISLQATEFAGAGENDDPIPASAFSVTGQGTVTSENGTAEDVDQVESVGDLASETQIASTASGSGAGDFTWNVDTELVVPAGQLVDTYSSTVTQTSSEDPDV